MLKKLLGLALLALAIAAPAHAQTFNQRAVVSISSASGDRTVITGLSGKTISVYGFDLSLSATTSVTLKCGSTALTGAMPMNAWSKPVTQAPAYFVCAGGSNLVINLGTSASMGGVIFYRQE